MQHRRLTFDRRILLLALLTGVPGSLVALLLLWLGDYRPQTQWTLSILTILLWLACAFTLLEKVRFPLQTLSNLLAALREGDYSIRARGARVNDTLGEVMLELNSLGANLREQRLGAVEASALLGKVMDEIEVAVFAIDAQQRLQLVNRAGERLLAQPAERLLKRGATELGLASCLEGEPTRTIQMTFPGGIGRWGMRRSSFREGGVAHQLLVLTDLSKTLREEERLAWQRLVRVLGHELNNSLAPIKSIAGSLEKLMERDPLPGDWKEDTRGGLAIITGRAESLTRFMEAYSRLARLPQPRLRPVALGELVRRVAGLETRLAIKLFPGPELTIQADGDQLEQLLINLVRNAVDASLETKGGVTIGWTKSISHLEIKVEDEGPGIANPGNLFVPFFTTKSQGTGIGLVLSRQIAEAHGGGLVLENRQDARGCVAHLRLPLAGPDQGLT